MLFLIFSCISESDNLAVESIFLIFCMDTVISPVKRDVRLFSDVGM